MKILVFEYVTGGGMRQEPIPPALAEEGGQMLKALVEDLLAIPGLELRIMHDDRLLPPFADKESLKKSFDKLRTNGKQLIPLVVSLSNPSVVSLSNPSVVSLSNPSVVSLSNPSVVSLSNHERNQLNQRFHKNIKPIPIDADADFESVWLDSIQNCDAVWPIAPETGGILERLCRDVENAGKALLNSPAAAVRLAASKSATVRRLCAQGLPTIPTVPLPEWQDRTFPVVIKPDDGVGCEGNRIIRDAAQLQPQTEAGNWIAQPLLTGDALSLSALFAQGQARLLSINRQLIEQTGDEFVLKGCQVNAFADTDGHWQALAGQIAQAVPELWGYVGIDLILTENGPVILEINPRLTTSYAGLHKATGENPASMVLDLWRTGTLPSPRTTTGKPVEILLDKTYEH